MWTLWSERNNCTFSYVMKNPVREMKYLFVGDLCLSGLVAWELMVMHSLVDFIDSLILNYKFFELFSRIILCMRTLCT